LNFAPNPYAAYEIMTWIMGSLADKSWTQVWLVLLCGCGRRPAGDDRPGAGCAGAGEAQAQSLGVNLTRLAALVVAGTR